MATILVIDDDNVSRTALRLYLEQEGYRVIDATTGAEGERLFAMYPIDIIFTDIFMPEQDGLQTIINIRKTDKAIPIIAMSTGGMIGELDYLRHSKIFGATHAFPKPFTAGEIQDAFTIVKQHISADNISGGDYMQL